MTTPTHAATPGSRYGFDNSSAHAVQQLASLQAVLDPITTAILDQLPVQPGWSCMDVGAGGGSIAHWLANKVGSAGHVTAIDLDTVRLMPADNLTVVEHDIRTGLPHKTRPHLIHARLLLQHLAERHTILDTFAETLAPGGWLILGEFGDSPHRVYTAPTPTDADLFGRVVDAILGVLQGSHGVDMQWADRMHTAMAERGLINIRTIEHAESWTGGSPGSQLYHTNMIQKREQLLAAGLSEHDLIRFGELMSDPAFAARSYRFVCTRAQRPR